jgi:hypothetical protein
MDFQFACSYQIARWIIGQLNEVLKAYASHQLNENVVFEYVYECEGYCIDYWMVNRPTSLAQHCRALVLAH